jgi:hypothetical protein
MNLEQSDLQLTSTFSITGLSKLVSKKTRTRLQADFNGTWAIELDFPHTQNPDSNFMVRVVPTAPLSNQYGNISKLTITLDLKTHDAVVQKTHSFELDPHDNLDGADRWIQFLTLSALWTDNSDIQQDDGFHITVTITSVPPPTRPVIAAPLILNNMLQLIEGHDVIDTKFMVFSKRRVADGSVGASDPLPVYANSHLVRSQCAHFDTSMPMFIRHTESLTHRDEQCLGAPISQSLNLSTWIVHLQPNPSISMSMNPTAILVILAEKTTKKKKKKTVTTK